MNKNSGAAGATVYLFSVSSCFGWCFHCFEEARRLDGRRGAHPDKIAVVVNVPDDRYFRIEQYEHLRDRIEAILMKIGFGDINTPEEFVCRNITAEDIKSEMLQAGGPPDAFDYSLKTRFSVLTTRNGVTP